MILLSILLPGVSTMSPIDKYRLTEKDYFDELSRKFSSFIQILKTFQLAIRPANEII